MGCEWLGYVCGLEGLGGLGLRPHPPINRLLYDIQHLHILSISGVQSKTYGLMAFGLVALWLNGLIS